MTASLIVHDDFSHIAEALRSLWATTRTTCQVYVTVNRGEDAQVERLRTEFSQARLLVNAKPQGFAANHNRIMRLAETEYVALLNDDILLHEGALDHLVAYLDDNPQVGLAGPSLQNLDGTPQVSVYSDPTLLRMLYKISGLAALTHQQSATRRWLRKMGIARLLPVESLREHTASQLVPIVKGVVMVVRRAAYKAVGLMDESTLAYGEEPDWHLRLRQAGWQVAHVPDARVTHYRQGQTRLELPGQMLVEDRKAILNYFLKHRPSWESALIRADIIVAHAFWGAVCLLFRPARAADHFHSALVGLTWRRESAR